MSIIIKTEKEIELLREGGKRLARILREIKDEVRVGVSTAYLDTLAQEKIKALGDTPAFLGYRPVGHSAPFPAALCVSVNAEIVHGIPKEEVVLKDGDVVSIDLGLKHEGVFTDHAVTVIVGSASKEKEELVHKTREALYVGIEAITPGGTVGDIGHAIESYVDRKYGIVRVLAGHGVGREIHEDPYVPNYGKKGEGEKLVPGMVIAIEPMLTLGSEDVVDTDDGYTLETEDGSIAAHFEHTVLITDGGYEILTQ